MEGVILFVDDEVFNTSSFENKLFVELSKDNKCPVLPINNLDDFEKTIGNISLYNAIVLDWEFVEKIDEIENKRNPLDILIAKDIFSLIYVYSHTQIGEDTKAKLRNKFDVKIDFLTKLSDEKQLMPEKEKIVNAIQLFKDKNPHLNVPFYWTQAINQSAQLIFSELEAADSNWIKELYTTAQSDGVDPKLEVINVFQSLLAESIIQNQPLIESIESYGSAARIDAENEVSLAKLYNRIYYTKLSNDSPLMTGDIFDFKDNIYGILITPECDVRSKQDIALDFLVFNKDDFDKYLKDKKQYQKSSFPSMISKEKQKKDLISQFNNGSISFHILPSFPFEVDQFKNSAFIDFERSFVIKKPSEFREYRTDYKLNSPYIFQLRQRYLAFIGRVGVPALPQSLKLYNLK